MLVGCAGCHYDLVELNLWLSGFVFVVSATWTVNVVRLLAVYFGHLGW